MPAFEEINAEDGEAVTQCLGLALTGLSIFELADEGSKSGKRQTDTSQELLVVVYVYGSIGSKSEPRCIFMRLRITD